MKTVLIVGIYLSIALNMCYVLIWINVFNAYDTQAERVEAFHKLFPNPSTLLLCMVAFITTVFVFWTLDEQNKRKTKILHVILAAIQILWLGFIGFSVL